MLETVSEDKSTTIVKGRGARGCLRPESVLFTYYVRRRDGERPLAICGGVVAVLTLYLALKAATSTSDWRPLGFYGVFCILSLISAVILTLQWKNDELVATEAGLTHFDWRRRPVDYSWTQITHAVEVSRPGNRRLILSVDGPRALVIHDDFPGYSAVAEACREQLARVGREVETG